jgi:hypothetical protein
MNSWVTSGSYPSAETIRVLRDGRVRLAADHASLDALAGIGPGLLKRELRHGKALDPARHARGIHHDEHRSHCGVPCAAWHLPANISGFAEPQGRPWRFVLSNSGHIAAIVNPPSNKRATFRTAGEDTPADAETWMERSVAHQGSWWEDWNAWLDERSGGEKPAPRRLGSRRYPIAGAAPGEYVHEH